MKTWFRSLALSATLAAALPAAAFAQSAPMAPMGAHPPQSMTSAGRWYVSPFTGSPFGGDTTHASSSFGVSGGWIAKSWLALEAELADSPELFDQNGFLTSRRVTTLMGNAIVPFGQHGRLVPFVAGGLGLFRPELTEAGGLATIKDNRLGYNVGGGGVILVHEHVGVRADIRYFHGLRQADSDTNALGLDVSKFGFWRVAGGLAIRF